MPLYMNIALRTEKFEIKFEFFQKYFCRLPPVRGIFCYNTVVIGLDALEGDCIASIPDKFLLNCMAGGNTIIGVKSKEYNPADFRLPTEPLNDLKDRILCFQKEHDLA